jgi:uncharacterized protein YjiS (DUF1127 family)
MIMLLCLSPATPARIAASVGRAFRAGAAALRAVAQQRRTYGSLSALDDRTLKDIGLNRTMLMGVAVHGLRSARDAEALPIAPVDALARRRTALRCFSRMLSKLREGFAANDLRSFERRLGPNQLKELSSSASGLPADRSPFP